MKNYIKIFDYKKKEHVLILAAGTVATLLVGWFIVSRIIKPAVIGICRRVVDTNAAETGEDALTPVEIQTVQASKVTRRINTVGRVKANASVDIHAELAAKVKKIHFTEGSEVKEGDILIEFEDEDQKAAVDEAEARVETAQAAFDRVSDLRGKNVESVKNFEEAKGNLHIAKAKLDEARARLKKHTIRAPFTGVAGITQFSVGAYVQPNQELMRFVDNSQVKVDFKVGESFINEIGIGQRFEAKIAAFPDQIFEGTVSAVEPRSEQESHSIPVRGTVPNELGMLKDGLFANISLIIGEKDKAIMIDESAIERLGEIEYVWAIERGKSALRKVLTGTREKGKVEIVAGLNVGDVVVIAGNIQYPGMRVKITNAQLLEPGDPNAKKPETAKAEDKVADVISATGGTGEKKPNEQAPAAPAQTKPAEVKAEQVKPAEAKPAAAQDAQTKNPEAAKPDAKPAA